MQFVPGLSNVELVLLVFAAGFILAAIDDWCEPREENPDVDL